PAQAAKMRRRPAAALPAAPAELAPPIGERPQRGLSADLHGEPCYILDTFMLRGAVMADIGLVRAQRDGSRFTLGKLQTVSADALSNVRFYFHIVQANVQRLLLEVAGTGQDTRPLEVAAACLQGQADATSPFAAAPRQAQAVRHIRPQAASAHAEEWGHRLQKLACLYRVDGALLAVPEATDGEGWRTLEPILEALLWKIKATRLEAGLSLLQSCPTFHCTDNFRAQRLKLEALYKRLWRDCAVGSQGNTKKGPAKRRRVQDPGALTVVAGDPVHDLLALRRRVSTMACDSTDLTFDHADLLRRLSAPEQR
ncbi:unnamed protein product, partial [Effrenium voratum]